MSVTTLTASHPVLGCVAEVRAALETVADVQPVFMSTAEKQTALVELARAEAQLAELRLRVLAASDDVGVESGSRDAAAWVSHVTRTDPTTSRADALLARRLERRPLVAGAMREGRVSAAQAHVLAAVLEDLPDHLGAQVAVDAETTLVAFAEQFRPAELRRLGRRLLEVVAPEIAEAEEAKRLADQEARAFAKAFLKFQDLGEGLTRLWGALPTAVAERLKRYLQAYTSPRRAARGGSAQEAEGSTPSSDATGERVPQHRAYARAFGSLLELLDPDRLPEHGGDATTVVVTLTLDQLRADLATAGIAVGDGELAISAEEARRLACSASIIPLVLGGESQPLDIGRAGRLHRPHQRKAIRNRDGRCRAEGCTIPADWCEIHHLRPWSAGGGTSVGDGVCFCSHHHHVVHDRRYEQQWLPNGDVRFRLRR